MFTFCVITSSKCTPMMYVNWTNPVSRKTRLKFHSALGHRAKWRDFKCALHWTDSQFRSETLGIYFWDDLLTICEKKLASKAGSPLNWNFAELRSKTAVSIRNRKCHKTRKTYIHFDKIQYSQRFYTCVPNFHSIDRFATHIRI